MREKRSPDGQRDDARTQRAIDREALRALADAIRQAREEQGLDVEQLAAAADISPEKVRALEAGDPDAAAELLHPTPAAEDQDNREALRALGQAIRRTREEQGLLVEQLAASTGLHPDDILALEAGQLDVSIHALRLITAATGGRPSRMLDLAEKLERYRHGPSSHNHGEE